MQFSRILSSFALLNPFAVKVAASGDALFAYRNVLGIKVAVHGKASQQAIVDYVSRETFGRGIDKGTITGPLGFVDPRKGDLLQMLIAPIQSRAVPVKPQATELPPLMSAKLYDKRPAVQHAHYTSAVDKRLKELATERLAQLKPALYVTNPDLQD